MTIAHLRVARTGANDPKTGKPQYIVTQQGTEIRAFPDSETLTALIADGVAKLSTEYDAVHVHAPAALTIYKGGVLFERRRLKVAKKAKPAAKAKKAKPAAKKPAAKKAKAVGAVEVVSAIPAAPKVTQAAKKPKAKKAPAKKAKKAPAKKAKPAAKAKAAKAPKKAKKAMGGTQTGVAGKTYQDFVAKGGGVAAASKAWKAWKKQHGA